MYVDDGFVGGSSLPSKKSIPRLERQKGKEKRSTVTSSLRTSKQYKLTRMVIGSVELEEKAVSGEENSLHSEARCFRLLAKHVRCWRGLLPSRPHVVRILSLHIKYVPILHLFIWSFDAYAAIFFWLHI